MPIALHVIGNAEILNQPQLSIVGSRNPTPAGRDIAFGFAESVAALGLCITSGLAEGIDSAAHRGAPAAQGITIALLGSGLDIVYPTNNRALSEEIRTRRSDQRIAVGHTASTRKFSATKSHHRRDESRHAGGRSRAPQRLLRLRPDSRVTIIGSCSPCPAPSTTP